MFSLPSFDRLLRREADIVLYEVVTELLLRVRIVAKQRDDVITRLRLVFDDDLDSVSLTGIAVYETATCASGDRQLVTRVASNLEPGWVIDSAPEVNTSIDGRGVFSFDSGRVVLRGDREVCNSPHIGIGVVAIPMEGHARIWSVEIELKTVKERRVLSFSFNVVELHCIEAFVLFGAVVNS